MDRNKNAAGAGACGGFYGMGFIGALVYFLYHASSFMDGLIGVLKSLVWPAFLVYRLLEFLNV